MQAVTEATKRLRKCQVKKCSRQTKANEQFENQIKRELQQVFNDVSSKKIKSEEEMKARVIAIKDKVTTHKSNIDIIKCSLAKCENDLRKVLTANLNMMKSVCAEIKDAKLCNFVKEHGNVPKKLDYASYMKFVGDLNNLLVDA